MIGLIRRQPGQGTADTLVARTAQGTFGSDDGIAIAGSQAILEDNGIPASTVSSYVPSEEQEKAWEVERDRFIQLALAPLADSAFRNMSSTGNDFTDFQEREE